VREADGRRPALEIITSGEKIDLLLTDVVMPGGLNGKELAAKRAGSARSCRSCSPPDFPAPRRTATSHSTRTTCC